jgi:AcrR family transcriptional regulator
MAQRPKTRVREAILQAAAEAFARFGFERAALGDIVERAGTSIGNLYKYFANKEALLAEVIPRGFTAQLTGRVRAQVEALRGEPDVFRLEAAHPYRRASEELLSFTLAHRDRVVFLLLRAHGTKHERFAGQIVRVLVALALKYARTTYPAFTITPASTRALSRLYRAFVGNLGNLLVEERSEQAVRGAVAFQTTYHLSGLRALFEGVPRPGVVTGGLR